MKKYAFIASLFFLTACSGLGVGIAGGALTGGAALFGGAVQEDFAAAAEWRGAYKFNVNIVLAAMLAEARRLEETDWDAAFAMYEKALEFQEKHQPQILLKRLKNQIGE